MTKIIKGDDEYVMCVFSLSAEEEPVRVTSPYVLILYTNDARRKCECVVCDNEG